ncbi:MAG: sulfate permease [Magnetospirillum sp.]|nr:sulfate permease [Magnetospirillum sp.]
MSGSGAAEQAVTDADMPEKTKHVRFAWGSQEVSGAFGDLGTFLPHVVAAIAVVGMDPTGVLVGFGLFYMFTGGFYGLPVAVQPMKAASAAVLVDKLPAGAIAASGMMIGLFFALLAMTGLLGRLAKILPRTVAAGLQLGLGMALALLGLKLMATGMWLGAATAAVIVLLLPTRRLPVALIALVAGTAAGMAGGLTPPLPEISLGFHLPALVVPTWEEVTLGFDRAVLPQLPLTITNAIIVAAALSRQLFPDHGDTVTEKRLALTTGIGNLVASAFGGYPMCHGAGGMAAHHRFGARSGAAPIVIGVTLLALGLLLGEGGYNLLKLIPDPVLGALLLFSGIDLAQASKPHTYDQDKVFVILIIAALCLATPPAIAFLVGLALAICVEKGWLRIS